MNNKHKHAGHIITIEGHSFIDWPPESPDNQYHLNK
jgi:hypothetical protein